MSRLVRNDGTEGRALRSTQAGHTHSYAATHHCSAMSGRGFQAGPTPFLPKGERHAVTSTLHACPTHSRGAHPSPLRRIRSGSSPDLPGLPASTMPKGSRRASPRACSARVTRLSRCILEIAIAICTLYAAKPSLCARYACVCVRARGRRCLRACVRGLGEAKCRRRMGLEPSIRVMQC